MHRLAVLLPLRTNLACSPHKARTLWPGIVLRTFSDCIFFDHIQLTFHLFMGNTWVTPAANGFKPIPIESKQCGFNSSVAFRKAE